MKCDFIIFLTNDWFILLVWQIANLFVFWQMIDFYYLPCHNTYLLFVWPQCVYTTYLPIIHIILENFSYHFYDKTHSNFLPLLTRFCPLIPFQNSLLRLSLLNTLSSCTVHPLEDSSSRTRSRCRSASFDLNSRRSLGATQ